MLRKKYNYWYFLRIIFAVLALVTAIIIFFSEDKEIIQDEGVVFVVDISNSMNTDDIKSHILQEEKVISRLDVSKQFITKYIQENLYPQDYGLILFSKISNYYIPITNDTSIFLEYLNTITTNQLPFGGTNIKSAFDLILEQEASSKYILLSDLWDISEVESQKEGIENIFNINNINLTIIGVWSDEWWYARYSDGTLIRDENKDKVLSIRNDSMWKRLSKNTKGKYYKITSTDDVVMMIDDVIDYNRLVFSNKQKKASYTILSLLAILAL